MLKLLSVDVWDTLLRRKGHPDCIKLASCRFILLKFYDRLSIDYRTTRSILDARLQCEDLLKSQTVKEGGDREFLFNNLIQIWLSKILKNDEFIKSNDIKIIFDYELLREKESSFVDPIIVSTIKKYSYLKIIFLSDFHLSSQDLIKVIKNFPELNFINEGVSSADVGINKRNGRLFCYIREKYKVLPNQHMHIGDDMLSDIIMSQKNKGISFYYKPEKLHKSRLLKSALFFNKNILFYFLFNNLFELEDKHKHDINYCLNLYKVPILLFESLKHIELLQKNASSDLELKPEIYKTILLLSPYKKIFSTYIDLNFNIDDELVEYSSDFVAIEDTITVWSEWIDAYVVMSDDLVEIVSLLSLLKNEKIYKKRRMLKSYLIDKSLPGWFDLFTAIFKSSERKKLYQFCSCIQSIENLNNFKFPFMKLIPAFMALWLYGFMRQLFFLMKRGKFKQ